MGNTPKTDKIIKEVETEERITNKDYSGNIVTMLIHPNMNSLITASALSSIRQWDFHRTDSTLLIKSDANRRMVSCMAISPKCKYIVTGSSTIRLWDYKTKKLICKFTKVHKADVHTILFTNDEEKIISGDLDSIIKLWNIKSRKCIMTYYPPKSFVHSTLCLIQHKNYCKRFLLASQVVTLWDTRKRKPLKRIGDPEKIYHEVVAIPNKAQYFLLDHVGEFEWRDLDLELPLTAFSTNIVNSLRVSSDLRLVCGLTENKVIAIWNIFTKNLIAMSPTEEICSTLILNDKSKSKKHNN